MIENREQWILENYKLLSLRAMAFYLQMSHEGVNQIIKKMGLRKERVKKQKFWARRCLDCGSVIMNEKYNEYCDLCRRKRRAQVWIAINKTRNKKNKSNE